MTESAAKTAMRLGADVRIASHIESRLKDPRQLEEAIRMFYAGTLPYELVYNSDNLIDLETVKSQLIKNLMKPLAMMQLHCTVIHLQCTIMQIKEKERKEKNIIKEKV